jgi:hypothetical protein
MTTTVKNANSVHSDSHPFATDQWGFFNPQLGSGVLGVSGCGAENGASLAVKQKRRNEPHVPEFPG